MYLHKVISKTLGVLKVTDEKSRIWSWIRIRYSEVRIRVKMSRIRNTDTHSGVASACDVNFLYSFFLFASFCCNEGSQGGYMIFSPFPRCHEFPILIGLINCSAYADTTFDGIITLNTDIKAVKSSMPDGKSL
jgi:hypothetical protein